MGPSRCRTGADALHELVIFELTMEHGPLTISSSSWYHVKVCQTRSYHHLLPYIIYLLEQAATIHSALNVFDKTGQATNQMLCFLPYR